MPSRSSISSCSRLILSMDRSRELGKQYGVQYAEAFHYIGAGASGADRNSRIDTYVKEHAIPKK